MEQLAVAAPFQVKFTEGKPPSHKPPFLNDQEIDQSGCMHGQWS